MVSQCSDLGRLRRLHHLVYTLTHHHRELVLFFKHKWFQLKYPPAWAGLNITFLELFPILVAVYVFGEEFQNTTIIFHTDNQAIVHVLNNQTSKEKLVMVLVRNLILVCLARNIKFVAQHVPGITNMLPDRLSHFQETPQLLREYGMKPLPEPVLVHLWLQHFKIDC